MKRSPRKEVYSKDQWVNPTTEALRKDECLCLNCLQMNKCVIASELFKICVLADVDFIMTRCPKWKGKEGQQWNVKL